jgi:tellurite resistance protein TerC
VDPVQTAALAPTSVGTPALWIGFSVVVFAVLVIDLYIGSKNHGPMSKRAAVAWTAVWLACAAAFGAGLYFLIDHDRAREAALEFATCYLVEYSLSIDNLFVFLLLFSAFKVPPEHQHRVLFWGIFGAIVLRAAFIFLGSALLTQWHFLIYVFGVFLIYTGIKLLIPGGDDSKADISDNAVVKLARRFIRVHDKYDQHHFFTVHNGVRLATPLLLVLVSVELSDVVFALDSIPAVFGFSTDPFIIYTSNIFAILGLRSLFFLLAGVLWGLRFLKPALGVILAFVGVKMCLPLFDLGLQQVGVHLNLGHTPISPELSLGVVGGMLAIGIAASVLFPGKKPEAVHAADELKDDLDEVVHPERHPHGDEAKH